MRAGEFFPRLNAALNAAAGVLLLLGTPPSPAAWYRVHVAFMLSALSVSAVFLTSYLYYHFVLKHGPADLLPDQWPDARRWMETVYLAVLGTHTVLAAATRRWHCSRRIRGCANG